MAVKIRSLQGASFISYAIWWIRHTSKFYYKTWSLVIDNSAQKKLFHKKEVRKALTGSDNEKVYALADDLDVAKEEIMR
jgi:DNA-directed RNA polymerase sigma subunit (sigma70/sigma32)